MEKEVDTDMLWEQRFFKVYCIKAVIECSYNYKVLILCKKKKEKRERNVLLVYIHYLFS